MAGAAKKRAQAERRKVHTQNDTTEDAETSSKHAPTPVASGRVSPASPTSVGSPGRFDGNRDPATRSRSGSESSQPAAISSTIAVRQNVNIVNKNLDLGAFGASMMNGNGNARFAARPAALNTSGREVTIKLNTFHVESFPAAPIYQYDVFIGDGKEKRMLIEKIWTSEQLQAALGPGWVFDGNKLAWSLKRVDDMREMVDLNLVNKRPAPPPGQPARRDDKKSVKLRCAKQLDFASLRGFLEGKADFNVACLEAMNFFDHLLRETPSTKYTVSKRNFFARGQERFLLGGGVEAFRGVYASIRIAHAGLKLPARLSINVDVANTTFWTESTVLQTALQLVGSRDYNDLATRLRGAATDSLQMRALRRLRRVKVYCAHDGKTVAEAKRNAFTISTFETSKTARNTNISVKLPGEQVEKSMTVLEYFKRRWNKNLQHPDLPLVTMTKVIKMGGADSKRTDYVRMPMELCTIVDNQRYNVKLSDKQTTEMIKFAVTLPRERWGHIEQGLKMLDWGNDKYLANYGLRVNTTPLTVKGRLLQNPKVTFAKGKNVDPRTSGRWDLRGQQFIRPFPKPLKSWAVCVLPGRGPAQVEPVRNFMGVLMNTLGAHGCRIENKEPPIIQGTANPGQCVERAWEAAGNQVKARPDILFFVVPDKATETYKRIKKSAECRYGVVSQVMQMSHVMKASPQYCSNVAMKINAKLGGVTAQAIGSRNWFNTPTMIIGADVSHGPARTGDDKVREPSIAAFTMSFDREAIKYIAAVETNGYRVELVTKANFDDHLSKMTRAWMVKVAGGQLPKHVIYMRDGVSEGQYAQVIDQEVKDLRNVFNTIDPKNGPLIKYTVVVGTKRHHVRFFPDSASGDKNSNPQPGTLIETGVTHPREFDFYLCSHSAIKGTARPVHYVVLVNEMNLDAATLQNMLYDGSYQFVRSTTPVSMYPAAYYAHLAAERATSHVDVVENAKVGTIDHSSNTTPPPSAVPRLMPMPTAGVIQETMWWV